MKQMVRILCMLLFMGCSQAPLIIDETYMDHRDKKKETAYLYIRIPEAISPVDQGNKYEKPIEAFLLKNGLGDVVGGGTFLAQNKGIIFVSVDVDVYNPRIAIPALVEKLRELGVPHGTVIEQPEPYQRVIRVW